MRAPRHCLRKQLFISCAAIMLGIGPAPNAAWAQPKTIRSRWFFALGNNAGALKSTTTNIYFGKVAAGTSKTLSASLSNSGTTAITIYSANSNLAVFSLTGLSLPLTLAAGQRITLQVTFSPQASGHVDGIISFRNDASGTPLYWNVHGTGVAGPANGALGASPATISFGNVLVGGTVTQPEVLTNSGAAPLNISQISVSGSGFNVSGASLPLTLAAGQSVNLSVAFNPQSAGTASGSLSVSSNASNPSLTIPLAGTSTLPGVLSASSASMSFGTVLVGSSQSLAETLTNSGGSSLTVSQVNVTGTGFNVSGLTLPLTLSAGQAASFAIGFDPQSTGTASGSLSVSSNASNPSLTIPLTGSSTSPGVLSASSASMSFGSVLAGSSQSLAETLTNSGGSSLTISQVNVTGSGFSVSGLTLPLTLAAGQAASFAVGFSPQSAGAASGSLSVTSNASNPSLTILLTGNSVTPGVLSASSATMSFGSQALGNASTLSETLTNAGGSSITVSQVSMTGAGFSTSGLSVPLTLVSGQSFTFGVSFAPTLAGSASGTVTVASNASNPSLSVSLSGVGTSSSQATVSLSWTPSISMVAGYNIYRGGQSGGPYAKLNATTSASTTYQDASVQIGQNYFYVTTAVTSNGMESGYSNEVQTAIPGGGGLAGLLATTSSSLSFGSVRVGSSQALSETLTNSGSASVTVTQANLSGAGFSASGLSVPLTLTPGQNVTFSAAFTPTSAGNASGSLTIASNASDASLAIALAGSGTAAGQLAITPSGLSFGSVAVGKSQSLTAIVSASGSSVTISSATANTAEFVLSGVSFPLTLAAGQSAALTVSFTPQASGLASDTLSLLSNASNSPAVEPLSGNGSAAVQHSVTLSWTDTGSGITGYNIYRAANSGGPFLRINSGPGSATTYTDNSVQAGQTYYYSTTAVNANGSESAYSNQVQAVIPTP